ncbi:MAG: CDP-glycerol glycerophosphotransferase family protein, partial [Firmicutes bacterium]|nr:CDP-glycerol glycerophosphotransferase family protein [Bacillota bacterium]
MLKDKALTLIKSYARNHVGFRKFAKGVRDTVAGMRYERGNKKTKTDGHLIYFNTFFGSSYADSPKAMYEYMLKDPAFDDFRFVWMFKDPDKYRFLEENRDTVLVKRHTAEDRKAAQEAGYWITNYRMLETFIPKKEQIYVQCWHGTPLKKLGYDLVNSDNAMNTQEEIFKKYKQDTERLAYLISPSPFATEKFTSAWNLEEFGKEDIIIEEGYPRNDRLITATDEDIAKIKENLGLSGIEKKIILYAPTWRDNQYTAGVGYTYKTEVDFDYLREELGDDYIILFRAHYLVAHDFDFEKYEGFVYDVSDYDDINDLYLASDLLITDYSSVFFDYSNLKRPMLFYMYDIEQYRDEIRGFYLDLSELPGPIVENEKDLV